MAEDTDIVKCTVILLGKFNPAIFSPAWFAMNGLITESELAATETEAVHPQISKFSIEHLTVTCETNRVQLSLSSEPAVRVLDLALQLFRDLLPHTPLSAFGINYVEHWRLDSWHRRMALGRAMAPLEPWGDWGAGFTSTTPRKAGGLVHLTMRQPFDDEIEGSRGASIGPSKELTDEERGVMLSVNHHREFEHGDEVGARAAIDLLEREFDEAIRFAKSVVASVKDFVSRLEVRH